MTGALQGFLVVAVIVAIGWGVGKLGIVSSRAERDLSTLVVTVMVPCLLVTMLMDADVPRLLSSMLVVFSIATIVTMAAYALLARLIWKRPAAETIIGANAAGMANAGNIGIPVSAYVLGSAAYAAPAIVVQTAVLVPLTLVALDIAAGPREASRWRTLRRAIANPVLIATVVGVALALLPVEVPGWAAEPFRLIGQASVPVVLLAFGMSLSGQRPLARGSGRRDTIVATALKLVLMPLVAWALGAFVFHLPPMELLAVTVLASLPTAQNVLAAAQRHGRGQILARDSALISTVAAVPVLLVITALLGTG